MQERKRKIEEGANRVRMMNGTDEVNLLQHEEAMAYLAQLRHVLGGDTTDLAKEWEHLIGPLTSVHSPVNSEHDHLDERITKFDFRARLREMNVKDEEYEAISSSHFNATSPLSDSGGRHGGKQFGSATSPSYSRQKSQRSSAIDR